MISYFQYITGLYNLSVNLGEIVTKIEKQHNYFAITTTKAAYYAANVVVGTGYFDNPKTFQAPGSEAPKVLRNYSEPIAFYKRDVAVIGGGTSAIEAAVDLSAHGANVTIVVRDQGLKTLYKTHEQTIRDLIARGRIRAFFETEVMAIKDYSILLRSKHNGEFELKNDFVFPLIGYTAKMDLLKMAGVKTDLTCQSPLFNFDTMETNIAGLFVAGTTAAGNVTDRIFIKDMAGHAKRIIRAILA